MKRAKKTKLYKLSLFLLGSMFLVNFGFCWMPLVASAQILNKPAEIVPEISQKDVNLNQEGSCEETIHDYKTNSAVPQETQTDQNDTSSSKNTVLPCCLDHNKITQIDDAPKLEANNPIFYATSNENLSDAKALIQNSSAIQLLDLSPPKADILESVFKKE